MEKVLLEFKLMDMDWEVLKDLLGVLKVHLHYCLLKWLTCPSDSTPVLLGAIPSFEVFMMQWEEIYEKVLG